MEGFNISAKVNNKTLLGRTQDTLNIEPVLKESITKDDAGVTKKKIIAHTVTFSMNAIYELDASGSTTQLDRDDIIALVLKTGSEAPVTITYGPTSGDQYTGSAIITGYSEDSSATATDDATISLNFEIQGAFTKVA